MSVTKGRNFCKSRFQAQWTRNLNNCFPSVRDTLVHIMWAEWIWLERWKGI